MKAYKIGLLVIDNENIGLEHIIQLLSNTKYVYPHVKKTEERDIGEWSDNHPLNKIDTSDEYYEKLFGPQIVEREIPTHLKRSDFRAYVWEDDYIEEFDRIMVSFCYVNEEGEEWDIYEDRKMKLPDYYKSQNSLENWEDWFEDVVTYIIPDTCEECSENHYDTGLGNTEEAVEYFKSLGFDAKILE